MLLPNRMKNPKTLMALGMSCLVVAIVSSNLPTLRLLGPNWSHGLRGFLFGLSIGLNLWSVRLAPRQRQNHNGCRAA
jgi:hypothetical protein